MSAQAQLRLEQPPAPSAAPASEAVQFLVYLAPSPDGRRRPAGIEVCDSLLATSEGVDTFSTDRASDAWIQATTEARIHDRTDGWPVEPGLWIVSGQVIQRMRGPALVAVTWRRASIVELQLLAVTGRPFPAVS